MIENKKSIKIREIIKSSLENTNKKNIELKKLISSSMKLDRYLQTLEYISKK